MTQNHLAGEFHMLRIRLFDFNAFTKYSKFSNYTMNGEHNSPTWLIGHIGYIADIMILKAWEDQGRHHLIIDKNFGFSSNGKSDIQMPFPQVFNQVLAIFNNVKIRLAEQNCEKFLSEKSSYPNNCSSDKQLVIHAIQDIAYHLGQLGFIISGKTLR